MSKTVTKPETEIGPEADVGAMPKIDFAEKKQAIEVGGEPDAEQKGEVVEIDDARAAIYKKHDEQRRREARPAAEDEQKPGDQDTTETPPKKDEEVTVVVNGKERKILRSKIDEAGGVAAYQKNAAASELLNQASAEMRRVKEADEHLRQREQAMAMREEEITKAATQERPAPSVDADALRALAGNYHEAILSGDIDAASDLLLQLQGARNSATPAVEEIARQAAKQARAEIEAGMEKKRLDTFEANRLEALQEFGDEYPDIAQDPELHRMTNAKTADIYREHPDWEPKAIIKEAAKSVQKWMKDRGLIKSDTTDKLAAKRAQDTTRGASARAIPRPTPKPQTKSEYVEQLRKARGLE